ncbi:hypothetical protein NBRC110019_19680 [Neptunitalea chrysea]|uniref:Putative auto-transporter adhesin head GIN domain-containing protein n=1 Tax=Neptunitalea chrysea TaxID=1647581 RepID=A0A9W6EWG6_9FLAO|nr:head GIN domain-containing protein [Neptunitalea chrysea]GLB52928.1 hypothetical protein NBRC110019_19680 [Neptunitalea chrysea]
MKYIAVGILFVMTSFMSFAQNEITKSLGDFSEVKAFDGISVKLIRSDENKAVIKGKNRNDVVIVNKDGKLKIKMDISESFDGYNTFVSIYHKSPIYIIDANEQAFIENTEPFKVTELILKAQEGGEIDVYVDVERLEIKSVTGGQIDAHGTASTQGVNIRTGGEYHGRDLKTKQSYVRISAGGEAVIFATEYVDAEVKAGGDIDIHGSPKVIDKQTFLGGRIKEY